MKHMANDNSTKKGIFPFLERFFGYYIPGLFLLIITSGVFAEILLRKLFRTSLFGLEEFVSLAMIIITFLAMGAIQSDEAHVNMGFVVEKLKPTQRSKVQLVALSISLIVFMVLIYAGTLYARDLYLKGAITPLREWKVWPVYVAFPAGSLLITIRLALQLMGILKQHGREEEDIDTERNR